VRKPEICTFCDKEVFLKDWKEHLGSTSHFLNVSKGVPYSILLIFLAMEPETRLRYNLSQPQQEIFSEMIPSSPLQGILEQNNLHDNSGYSIPVSNMDSLNSVNSTIHGKYHPYPSREYYEVDQIRNQHPHSNTAANMYLNLIHNAELERNFFPFSVEQLDEIVKKSDLHVSARFKYSNPRKNWKTFKFRASFFDDDSLRETDEEIKSLIPEFKYHGNPLVLLQELYEKHYNKLHQHFEKKTVQVIDLKEAI
jgi:hypothetical protein